MFAALALATTVTTVVARSDDSYAVPQTERSVLEGRCHGRALKLIEQQGRMTLVVDDRTMDITSARFASSYVAGSYLGRFTIACRRADRGFSINFFGMQIARDGSSVAAGGSMAYDDAISVTDDAAIGPQSDLNLYQFNMRRNEYWGQQLGQ